MALVGVMKRASRNNWRARYLGSRRQLSITNTFQVEEDAKLPVLIVGAGPVGLVLSILLTKLGYSFTL